MSRTLAGKAAALANANGQPAAAGVAQPRTAAVEAEPAELPDVDLGESPQDWDQVPVLVAWLRVRREVRSLAKNQKYLEEYGQNRGQVKYNFRGVDQAVNAFGPVTLKHGVNIFSERVDATYRDTKTSTGKNTRECTVKVRYKIYGPMGDSLDVESVGESLDTGDKGTAKAMSVALRILLLHGGLIPTGDPDPDAGNIERGEASVRSAASYAEEILHPGTTRERMRQIRHELIQNRMMGASVGNEHGQPEPVGGLLDRVGRERFAPKSPPQEIPLSAGELPPVDDGVPEPPADVAARLAAEQAALFAGGPPA